MDVDCRIARIDRESAVLKEAFDISIIAPVI